MVCRNRKIGLIGRVGAGEQLFDGQTVKTRNMLKLLSDQYGRNSVFVVDTFNWRHRAPRIVAGTLRCLSECDDVVVLLSDNGRRVLFPILAQSAHVKGTRIYQNLIGGWLARNLEKYPKWVDYLNSFKVNWVESQRLANDLAARGVNNARYLPNFKYLKLPEIPAEKIYGNKWHFCTFSRVMDQKGIGDAIRAVESLNCDSKFTCELDIYGPVEKGYRTEFEAMIKECQHCMYKGSVPADESVAIVAGYDALLFPTKWRYEGIPGTIIDALTAGVPIIGAKWGYYDEMLEDGATGFGYEFGHNELLLDAIRHFLELTDSERNAMRRVCLERAKAYTPEAVSFEIRQEIGR
jgi:glycosyltransferase involved in cell wall biosynthesis